MWPVLWNLSLAAIPVVIAQALAAIARQKRWPSGLLRGAALLFLGFLWLAWLPNSIYLMTEWRHWLEIVDFNGLAVGAGQRPALYFEICAYGAFFFFYSLFGVLTFTGAVHPIEKLLRARGLKPYMWAPLLFLLVSIGVYLGLILRFNSWDLATRPGAIMLAILDIFRRPTLLFTILVFALAQWAIYEAVDLWLEAFATRLRALRASFG